MFKKKLALFIVFLMGFSLISLHASVALDIKLRLFEGIREGMAEPPRFVTSSFLHPTITANIQTEFELEKEKKQIQRVFNLKDVNLLTEADLKLSAKEGSVGHFFRLNGNEYEIRIRLMKWKGVGQFLVLVNEINDPSFGVNLDIGHSLIAGENLEDQVALICHYKKLFHTHFDDNDQQADIDLPPGTVNFIRLVSIMYVLDQAGYNGWYGLDLFPYRDDPVKFMELSVENLNLAQSVVDLMKERGADELMTQSGKGPEMAALIRDCIREAR